jgi:hypothetical protein
MRIAHPATAALLILASGTTPTSAATISGTYTFSASGFFGPPGNTVLADPVSGHFDVTFDNAVASGSLPVSNLSVNFSPISNPHAGYTLGLPGVVDLLTFFVDSGATHFSLEISNASTSPTLYLAEYQTGSFDLAFSRNGSVSFAPSAATILEPASIALFSSALVGFGLIRRRGRG